MRALVIALVLAAPAIAHADREGMLSVVGGVSIDGDADAPTFDDLAKTPLLGATLTYERPLPGYPGPGERLGDAQLTPELTIVGYHEEAMALAGLRMQVAVAENQYGPWRETLRAAGWLSPRVGRTTQSDDTVLGFDLGMTFTRHSRWRVGFSYGIYTWRQPVPAPRAFPAAPVDTARYLQAQIGLVVTGSL